MHEMPAPPASVPGVPSERIEKPWWAISSNERSLLCVGALFFLGSLFLQVKREGRVRDAASKATDTSGYISEWALSIAKELGGVLVVGVVVRILVDEAQQKNQQEALSQKVKSELEPAIKQVKDLSEDLGSTLRNKLILQNQDARELLDKKVLRPIFIRRNYELTLTIRDWVGTEHVEVSIENYYKVENVGGKPAKYSIRGWIDTLEDQWIRDVEPARFTSLSFGPIGTETQDSCRHISFTEAENHKVLSLERTPLALTLECEINPELPPNSQYFIRLNAKQPSRTRDQFVWNMAYVTEDLKVIIKLEGNLTWDNFEVVPELMHHLNRFTKDPEKTAQEEKQSARTWWLNSVLLPYQGVHIYWFPKRAESSLDRNTFG